MVLNVPLLRDSFALVVDREPQVVHDFYEILFERYPRVQPLFRRARAEQAKMMTAALVAVMDHLEDALWWRGSSARSGASTKATA